MQKRTTAAVLLTALALSLPASPALAGDRASGAPHATVAAAEKAPTTKAPKAKAPKAKAPSAKAPTKKAPEKAPKVKAVRMTLSGAVTAVEGDSVTFTVKGGRDKALRGKPLTVTVPGTARVVRNDEAATLADVLVGDKVTVQLVKAGEVLTARRLIARGVAAPAPAPTEPAPTEPAPTEPAPTEPAPAPTPQA